MISALAQGGAVLGEPRYVEAAARAAEFVVEEDARAGGKLMRSFKDGRAAQPGYLEDHAFLAAGLFDLYEASFDARWLREALALVAETEALFADGERGGWFMTSDRHEKLLARERPSYDGAAPSGTSVAMMNALRAATFTGDDRWRAVAGPALASYRGVMVERPMAMAEALLALDYRTDAVREIAIVWPAGAARVRGRRPRRRCWRCCGGRSCPTGVARGGGSAGAEGGGSRRWRRSRRSSRGSGRREGGATAYVCGARAVRVADDGSAGVRATDREESRVLRRWSREEAPCPDLFRKYHPPIGLILCAGKADERVELLELESSGIRVAQYLTELPPEKILERRFHEAIVAARRRLAG
jgi:uncharacterized protein YyaL (SSP411 family)